MAQLLTLKVPSVVNTSDHDIMEEFFIPLLRSSSKYDRGVGFFSSGWLRFSASGLIQFAENGGYARWVTSPILNEKDWEALKKGDLARRDYTLRSLLKQSILSLHESLEKDTLSALAWMIADRILEFKLATVRGKLDGEFHDKFGIFTDLDGNKISFSGSYNESVQGLNNYESFKVFKSWIPEQEHWVHTDVDRFEKLWNNQDPNVRVMNIGESNRAQIVKLRSSERPYKVGKTSKVSRNSIGGTEVVLRDYQEEAILNWFAAGKKGFYEMATGTGKTITALGTAKKLLEEHGRLGLIVAVPYQHLVDQWEKEAGKFGFKPIRAYKNALSWVNILNKYIIDFNNGYRDFIFVITTHKTFAMDRFQKTIARIQEPSMIIADEAHHLGSESAQRSYTYTIPYRLALSATPDRWFDDSGSAVLRDFFGQTVYEFPLAKAIGVSLTPYYYFPHLVELNDDEMIEYTDLTIRIAKIHDSSKVSDQEKLKWLFRERSNLLNRAVNKLDKLSKLIDDNPVQNHTLFYCAPGQIEEVTALLGREKGILVHPFTANEDNRTRQQLLADFADGTIQALTAIRCLDCKKRTY